MLIIKKEIPNYDLIVWDGQTKWQKWCDANKVIVLEGKKRVAIGGKEMDVSDAKWLLVVDGVPVGVMHDEDLLMVEECEHYEPVPAEYTEEADSVLIEISKTDRRIPGGIISRYFRLLNDIERHGYERGSREKGR